MVSKDLQRWLCVWIISWLELNICYSNFSEEFFNNSHEVTKADIAVSNQTFTLMELSKMCDIKCLVSEYSIDGEMLNRFELLLLSKSVEHLWADSSGMSSQEILLGFFFLPFVLVAFGAISTFWVDFLNFLSIFFRIASALLWVLDEESIVHVSCWMTLWLE